MPRAKRKTVDKKVKTALEIALEDSPSAVDDAATATMESAAKRAKPKAKRKRRTSKKKPEAKAPIMPVERSPLLKDFTPYSPPKMKFSRKRIRYKEGDTVEIVTGDETFVGTLISILASQLVVRDEEGRDKFFFQSGLNIKRLKKS